MWSAIFNLKEWKPCNVGDANLKKKIMKHFSRRRKYQYNKDDLY